MEDLIKNLKTPSHEIKIKILNIVSMNLNPKISEILLKELKKEINEKESEYLYMIIKTIENMAFKFNSLHYEIMLLIVSKIARYLWMYVGLVTSMLLQQNRLATQSKSFFKIRINRMEECLKICWWKISNISNPRKFWRKCWTFLETISIIRRKLNSP